MFFQVGAGTWELTKNSMGWEGRRNIPISLSIPVLTTLRLPVLGDIDTSTNSYENIQEQKVLYFIKNIQHNSKSTINI